VYLLDNDIFSIYFVRRNRAPNLDRKMQESQATNRVFLPIIAVNESLRGALSIVRRVESTPQVTLGYSLLQGVLSGISELPLVPFDDAAYAQFLTIPPSVRQAIGSQDSLIAAIALRHDLIVATGNQQHFERVPNLRFENWRRLPNPTNTI